MKTYACLALVALGVGCSGNMAVPNTDIADIKRNQESLATQQRELMQSNATLGGKFDTLIKLKGLEIEKLDGVQKSFDRSGDLLERVLTRPLEPAGR